MCSMISSQCDELRAAAQTCRSLGRHEMEQTLLDAADTILELRDDLQRANSENEKLRERIHELEMEGSDHFYRTAYAEDANRTLEAENAKLRNRIEELEGYVTAPPLEEQLLSALDENAKLHTQLVDATEGMGRMGWRCAKLRELMADMWNGMCGYVHDCRICEHYELYAGQRFVGECEYHRRMRELGVEADK